MALFTVPSRPSSKTFILVIRPDDVWLSMLTQFCLYVHDHVEELRGHFVSHKCKERLLIKTDIPFAHVDISTVAQEFTYRMKEKMISPEVRDWIIPNFTTTTENDVAIASTTMMATTKQ